MGAGMGFFSSIRNKEMRTWTEIFPPTDKQGLARGKFSLRLHRHIHSMIESCFHPCPIPIRNGNSTIINIFFPLNHY